jgi:membrane protease YdiL (CAAX protease family)
MPQRRLRRSYFSSFVSALAYRLRIDRPGFGPPAWSLLLVFCVIALWMELSPPTGFPRVPFVDSVRLSPDATVWSMGLGFPKVVTGILILGFMHQEKVRSWREFGLVLKRVMPVFLVTAAVVMPIAIVLGNVRFDRKWTPLFLVWAPVNLLFACMPEEVFFRGLIQRLLTSKLKKVEPRGALSCIAGIN